jgi:hypothetical protein
MRQIGLLIAVGLAMMAGKLRAQELKEEAKTVAPFATFKTTKLVNAPTPETHFQGDMNFIVSHRFGALANGQGFHTMFGLDNATGLRIGLEYGITDDWDVGVSRSQGSGARQELYNGFTKYRLIRQGRDQGFPFTVTYYGSASLTGMESAPRDASPGAFERFDQRLTYTNMAILGRRIGDRLSLSLMPTHIHRNLVANNDENEVFALGASGVFKVTKTLGIMGEYFYQMPRNRSHDGKTYRDPIGVGVEIETGGHVFQLTLNNSKGLLPSQFVPYSTAKWGEGNFRFGFSINRLFHL